MLGCGAAGDIVEDTSWPHLPQTGRFIWQATEACQGGWVKNSAGP